MDDGGLSPNSSFFGDIDLDFMGELLDDGCWLQTADGSKFEQAPPKISLLPALDISSANLTWFPQQDASQEEFRRCDLASTKTDRGDLEAENSAGPQSEDQNGVQSVQVEAKAPQVDLLWEGNDQNRIWIAPKADAGPSSSVKDRLMMAVRHFEALSRERDLLIQIWVPVRRGINNFLTTLEQPYSYDPNCAPLVHYRNVSEGYHFCADEDSKEGLGLPGRVFLGKFPEWTPDVRLFRKEEYPRVNYAFMYDVRGSVALPVFESRSGNCLGVVEIVTTTQKINYRPELESVCKALEAVDLRSSEIISPFKEKVEADVYNVELSEILHIIKTICEKHSLPLGQTWAPCTQHRKGGCWRLDKNALCISTIDSACYVHDQHASGFHEACYEQHLFQDQGIVGKAFMTNQPCFVADVTVYSKGEYPLSHHAKMFGLGGVLAMHLRCSYGALRSYVLEFFLPIGCHDPSLTFHSEVMESLRMEVQGCQSLSFFDWKDDEGMESLPSEKPAQEDQVLNDKVSGAQRKGKGVALPFDEPTVEINVLTGTSNNEEDLCKEKSVPGSGNTNQDSGDDCSLRIGKPSEKKRMKSQKSISLEVLKKHFSGSLKDAAKSIGVCPTTLKRICRQHGIKRWPSRKIKKVDHSLRKLQLVMDSVQGAQSSIKISSFYSKYPELSKPTAVKIKDQAEQLITANSTSSSGDQDPAVEGYIRRARRQTHMQALDQKISTDLETCHSNNISVNSSLRDGLVYKVKAMLGEDNIRLKLKPNMGFGDLQREIATRFRVGDVSLMQIKYLDDDKEWVLLTCDDDLEECIDLQRAFGSNTIGLIVSQAPPPILGSSFGSCGKS